MARLASRADDRHGARILAGEEISRDGPRRSRSQLGQIAVVEEQPDETAVEGAQHEHQAAVMHRATIAGVEIGGDLDGPDTILVEMAGLDVREPFRVGEIERADIRKRGLPAMKGTKGVGDRMAGRIGVDELTNLRLVQDHHVLRAPSSHEWSSVARDSGRRVPAILTVTAGAEATATGGGVATARVVEANDLVLTDTSPWIGGAWSDTANAVFVGTPDRETRRRFDAVRRALHEGIALCRPGAVAKDVDRKVRGLLAEHGPTYPHHTGHGIGAAWSEEPRITPYNEMPIEEGMVLALEPAIYLPGWGGIRLEHVFAVGATDNEILTRFEHTL